MNKKNNFQPKYLWLLLGLAIIFVVGSVATDVIIKKATSDFNNKFISLAQSYVAGVNPNRIANMTGSIADLTSPDYERLREQLSKMEKSGKSEGVRWIYTMRQTNERTIFLVDSVPSGQFGHSEPGDFYEAIPTNMLSAINAVWRGKKTVVVSPYTDQWGTFISVLTPISDFQTQEIYGILGIDIDHTYFKKEISSRQLPAVVGTIMLAVIFCLLFFYFNKSKTTNILIKEEREKFKAITESAKDAIVVMDNKGLITFWNNGAEEMFGYEPVEVMGRALHDFIVVKKEHHNPKNILHFGATGESAVLGKSIELPVKRKDGLGFFVELTVSRIKLGGLWHAVGIMRDITVKKKVADELKKKSVELERINRFMVGRELKMIELKKQIKMLEENSTRRSADKKNKL